MIGYRNTNRCYIWVIIQRLSQTWSQNLRPQDFLDDFKSKLKVNNEVKVIKKMKISGNWLKSVDNWKFHFQNFIFKISFSNFLYKFDICIGLSNFVVAEHWSRFAMYCHASRNLLSQTWETNACSIHSLCGNKVVLLIRLIYSLCWAFNIAGSYKQTLVTTISLKVTSGNRTMPGRYPPGARKITGRTSSDY